MLGKASHEPTPCIKWHGALLTSSMNLVQLTSDTSGFPYSYHSDSNTAKRIQLGSLTNDEGARTAIGLCLGVFLEGNSLDTAPSQKTPYTTNLILDTLAQEAMTTHLPTYQQFSSMNQYWMYYNTLGIFMLGGKRWDQWNQVVRDVLVNAQRQSDDCFHGSWDYQLPGNNYTEVRPADYSVQLIAVLACKGVLPLPAK